MADRRRRRQVRSNEEVLSEGESQQCDAVLLSVSDHESATEYVDLSEYESPDDEYDEDNVQDKSEVIIHDSDLNDHDAVVLDKPHLIRADQIHSSQSSDDEDVTRESGDGKSDNDQELKSNNKVLKISEDKSSPFYIPTKGNFYQHDVRSDESRRGRGRGTRGIRSDFSKEKWLHDKYDEDEQTSKTSDQLIEEYGYDIRMKQRGKSSAAGVSSTSRRGRRGSSRPFRGQLHQPRFDQRSERFPPPPFRGGRQSASIRSRNFHARRSPDDSRSTRNQSTRRGYRDSNELSHSTSDNSFERRSDQEYAPQSNDSSKDQSLPVDKPSDLPSDMNSVLDVINNREQGKSMKIKSHERKYEDKRSKTESALPERIKNLSMNREVGPPKRYSSLRQRAADVSHQTQPHSKRAPVEPPKHFTPQVPSEWVKQSIESQHAQQKNNSASANATPSPNPLNNNPLPPSKVDDYSMLQSNSQLTLPFNPPIEAAAGLPAAMMSTPSSVSKLDGATTSEAATLAQLQWYEAAIAYQQALLSSQNNLLNTPTIVPQQTPPHDPIAHSVGDTPLLLNSEHHPGSPPQLPPHSLGQGDVAGLNSLVFPPPLSHEFPTNNFMPRNMLADRNLLPPSIQLPFNPPNPMGQQVGGVTYYPNPLHPMQGLVPGNNPVGSPMQRLNTAIPIKYPME